MRSRRPLLTGAVALLAAAAVPLSFVGPSAVRFAVIGVFLLIGPGSALMLMLKVNDGPSPRFGRMLAPLLGSMAIGLSIAISLIVATAMVYARLWNPPAAVASLAGVTFVLLMLGMLRARHERTDPRTD